MAEKNGHPRPALRQLVRYGVMGLATNAAGFLVYLLVTWLGVPPKAAVTLLYPLAATLGFFGNRRYAFDHRGGMASSGARYVLAHCAGYLLTLAIQFLAVDLLGYSHQWAQGVAVFVVAGFLFLTFRYFVFPPEASKR